MPRALAPLALVLLAIIELTGEVSGPWQSRLATLGWALWVLFFIEFAVKFTLAPTKHRYLRGHSLDALIVLLPFLRVLRLARVLQAGSRLLVFGGRAHSPPSSFSSDAGSGSSPSSPRWSSL